MFTRLKVRHYSLLCIGLVVVTVRMGTLFFLHLLAIFIEGISFFCVTFVLDMVDKE